MDLLCDLARLLYNSRIIVRLDSLNMFYSQMTANFQVISQPLIEDLLQNTAEFRCSGLVHDGILHLQVHGGISFEGNLRLAEDIVIHQMVTLQIQKDTVPIRMISLLRRFILQGVMLDDAHRDILIRKKLFFD